jgi:hypothetical protein
MEEPWWRAATGAAIWDAVKAAWPPAFAPLFEPGASDAELDAAEERLCVTLPPRVRELVAACSGAGLPAPRPSLFPAECTLTPVGSWCHPTPLLGEPFDWTPAQLADHVVVGFNPEGADYSNPVLLRLSDATVHGFTLNIPEAVPLGPFDGWVATLRPPGCDDPSRMYADDDPDASPEDVGERHAFYLRFAPEEMDNGRRRDAWAAGGQAAFVAALRASAGRQ